MFAKKITGKPYAGKPHVRFDEGKRIREIDGEVFHFFVFSFYSTGEKREGVREK